MTNCAKRYIEWANEKNVLVALALVVYVPIAAMTTLFVGGWYVCFGF